MWHTKFNDLSIINLRIICFSTNEQYFRLKWLKIPSYNDNNRKLINGNYISLTRDELIQFANERQTGGSARLVLSGLVAAFVAQIAQSYRSFEATATDVRSASLHWSVSRESRIESHRDWNRLLFSPLFLILIGISDWRLIHPLIQSAGCTNEPTATVRSCSVATAINQRHGRTLTLKRNTTNYSKLPRYKDQTM